MKLLPTGILRSIVAVSRHAVGRRMTTQYPDEAPAVGFRFRGRHIFHQDVCIGCTQCERVCPVIAIKMETHKDPTSRKVVTDRFALDLGICYYCGLCEEVCPTDPKAIHLGPDFELATHDRRLLIYEMDQLTGPKPLPSKPKPGAGGGGTAAPAAPATDTPTAEAGTGVSHSQALFAIAFTPSPAFTLGSALLVVTLRNVVRAALALIACFFMVSWMYLMLNADLLWVAQLLIYAGAIPVLIVFAIMFTRRSMSDTSSADTTNRTWAALLGGGVFVLLLGVLLPAHWHLAPLAEPRGHHEHHR